MTVLFRRSPGAPAPLWLRVQLWAGLLPLAGYLVVHLIRQASVLWGQRAYVVWGAAEPTSWRLAVSVVLVYLPLLVHAGLGLRRLAGSEHAVAVEGSDGSAHAVRGASVARSVRRALQQLSAAVLFIFLLAHLWQFSVPSWTGALAASDYYPELCAALSSTRWGGVPWVAIGYLLGVAAAALHGAHGIYHGLLGLGFIRPGRERVWARCCGALGLSLFGLGALIVIDLATGSVLIHLPGS
jgi:succinate dehydrogenase / fumarate reductase cytochrome b subunit